MEQTFAALGLPEALTRALGAQGIETPTPVQVQAVPRLAAGENLLVQAPTGTGKTLAYLLPLLAKLDASLPQAQAVVLAPTQELSMQIARTAQALAQAAALPVRTLGLIGGANIKRQIEALKKNPQLVVGTTWRLLELAEKGKLKLAAVRLLVLDEFDRLLDDQSGEETAAFVRRLRRDAAGELQYALFSATAAPKACERAAFLGEPARITVAGAAHVPSTIRHYALMTPFREKAERVRRLSRRLGVRRGIVFINRAFDAERTLAKLRYDGVRADALVGAADKQARQKAIADFRHGRTTLLLATDLAARGLDLPEVDTVFNLDLPEDARTYLHRAGRTGRAGREGRVITLADYREAEKLARLTRSLDVELTPLPQGRPQAPSKDKKEKKEKKQYHRR